MKLIRTTELTNFCKMAGANLRKMRTTRKLTQVEVGRAIGVRFQQIQKYEVGSNCLSAWRLKQLAAFFDVSPLDILDAEYIAKCCNTKESRTIPVLHEQWAVKNGYRDNDKLNSKNTLGFEDGAKDKDLQEIYNRIFKDAMKYTDEFNVQMVAATYIAIAMRLYKTTLTTEEYEMMVQTIMDTDVEPYFKDKERLH